MIAPHEVYKRRRAILEHLGATFFNYVDATNGQDVIELLNGIADMYIWGSPHWNTFNNLFPKHDYRQFKYNGDYKASIVPELMLQYPGANIIMPQFASATGGTLYSIV